jgi:hypothetical protein
MTVNLTKKQKEKLLKECDELELRIKEVRKLLKDD